MSPTLAFGDDRSAGADACWDWIVNQRWDGWRLEVVTAEPPADMHPVEPEAAELRQWDPRNARHPVDRGFVSVEHLRAEIDPRLALIARTWDLVAIGPKGEGWAKTLHLGSTADWLLREPASPLLIARRSDPVRRVLLAADGSPHAKRAIETLALLPWAGKVVVRVVAADDGRVDIGPAIDDATVPLLDVVAEVDSVAKTGTAIDVIIEEIDEFEPDLVVMGARGQGGIKRLLLGSTTAAVAGSVDCSLLVAHANEGTSDR